MGQRKKIKIGRKGKEGGGKQEKSGEKLIFWEGGNDINLHSGTYPWTCARAGL